MRLRIRALGLAVGITWGLGVLVATIVAIATGKGHTLSFLAAYYYGYSVSAGGAIVGLVWGFVDGFIFGALVAWLYNTLYKAMYKSEADGK